MKVRVAFNPPVKHILETEIVDVARTYLDKDGCWIVVNNVKRKVYFVMKEI